MAVSVVMEAADGEVVTGEHGDGGIRKHNYFSGKGCNGRKIHFRNCMVTQFLGCLSGLLASRESVERQNSKERLSYREYRRKCSLFFDEWRVLTTYTGNSNYRLAYTKVPTISPQSFITRVSLSHPPTPFHFCASRMP